MHPIRTFAAAAALALCALPAAAQTVDAATAAKARRAHEAALVLDTHFDTPANFGRPGWSIMDRHPLGPDRSQVDYPRMVDGGVDGGFFAVFTSQGPRDDAGLARARDAGLVRTVEIREMVASNNAKFALALKADDAAAIAKTGRKFVFISMENAYPLGKDLTLMRTFYALGVRMMSPAHFANNDLADSATDPKGPEWGGLSPLGKQFVAEANRLGIVLDASHASDQVLDQMLDLSSAPIILSHSGVRAIYDHPRNVPDDLLRKLAAKGGVVQVNAFSAYMIDQPEIPERQAALADLGKTFGSPRQLPADKVAAYMAARAEIDAKWPVRRASLDDLVKHVVHAREVAGVDHVGVSGDFDGGGGVEGFDQVSDYPRLSERLTALGWTADDLAKLWGGNALRVLKEVEAKKAP